jgi:CubicO group peptidase (beta-lactamase class C family)
MKSKTFKKLQIYIVIILLIGSSAIPVFAINNDHKIELIKNKSVSSFDIDENITILIEEAKIPSLSVCIVKNNSIVWDNGYGKYNRLLGLVPTNQTVYMAASISKTITATALMQLYEKGKFKLDDDVSNYLPFVLRNPNHPYLNITFRMLLSHQSSLPTTSLKNLFLLGVVYVLFPNKFPYPAIKELLVPGGILYNPDVWTKDKPGEAFHYSNTGFFILGYLVERLSNQTFEDYCNDNILKPLKMYNSTFNSKDIKRSQRAVPYILKNNMFLRLPFYNVPDAAAGAGGLITSAEDLSHFLIAHMNNGTYEDVQILNNSSIELMHSIQYYDSNSSDVLNFDYGLGWMLYNFSGYRYQGHDGDTFGFSARMTFSETNNTGIILFFNRTRKTNDDIKLTAEFMDLLFSKAEEL